MVGLGPGDPALCAPEATRSIAEADAVVGYSTYLDLIAPELLDGKHVLSTGMMKEVDRCNAAIDLAVAGENTVVVSSGDSGVYGMSGLVLELVQSRGLQDAMDVRVVPGIPALAAAASLLGAPLMHDFAVISLSDLLTPWDIIALRLEMAAKADFVIVLYNPRSKRRDWQLDKALEVIGKQIHPETPVGLVRNAARENQSIHVCTIARLDTSIVDMLSILVIGNSTTRIIDTKYGLRMLTPRGYDKKYDLGSSQETGRHVRKAHQP